MTILRFLGFSTFSQVAGVLNTKTQKWRREILFCGHAVPNKETWFELIGTELLVEHSLTASGFAEAAGTEGNVE